MARQAGKERGLFPLFTAQFSDRDAGPPELTTRQYSCNASRQANVKGELGLKLPHLCNEKVCNASLSY